MQEEKLAMIVKNDCWSSYDYLKLLRLPAGAAVYVKEFCGDGCAVVYWGQRYYKVLLTNLEEL